MYSRCAAEHKERDIFLRRARVHWRTAQAVPQRVELGGLVTVDGFRATGAVAAPGLLLVYVLHQNTVTKVPVPQGRTLWVAKLTRSKAWQIRPLAS